MEVSKEFFKLLQKSEGREANVYPDSGGAPTIGIGHLLTKSERTSGKIIIGGVPVKYSFGLTEQQIDDLCKQDVKSAVDTVNKMIKVSLSQYQFEALVDFTFNVGNKAFTDSTLLRLLNQGNYDAVPAQMRRWNKDNGVIVEGLINRREHGVAHWLKK